MLKHTVFFRGEPYFEQATYINKQHNVVAIERAHVDALNHPKLGKTYVITSEVIEKYNDGSFETRNTFYLPA
jgi:histidinol phosphatase-like PHP family hydrolase